MNEAMLCKVIKALSYHMYVFHWLFCLPIFLKPTKFDRSMLGAHPVKKLISY